MSETYGNDSSFVLLIARLQLARAGACMWVSARARSTSSSGRVQTQNL